MDIQKSFNYVFEDESWMSKLGIGAVIAIVPILNFAWMGYAIGIIRNVVERHPRPLPSWDDLGKQFMDGLLLWLAGALYALPGIVLFFVPFLFLMLPALSNNSDVQTVLLGVGGLLFVVLLILWLLYILLLSFLLPAVRLNYVRYNTFAACFRVKEIIRIVTANMGRYLTAWGVSIGSYLVVSIAVSVISAVLGWIPCIGWLFLLVLAPIGWLAMVWIGAFSAHLFGQVPEPERAY